VPPVEIPLLVLADAANTTGSGKLNILGIFNRVQFPRYPFALPMCALVFRLVGGPTEFGTTKALKVFFMDADGNRLMELESSLTVPEQSGQLVFTGDSILTLANLVIPKPGTYSFEITVNGEPKARVALEAVQIAVEPET
jgi:hypothetical protein